MANKLLIVSGEASETDSEDEKNTPTFSPIRMATSIQGAVVNGEDSESDNETFYDPNVQPVMESIVASPTLKSEHNTLLHKKLYETNKQMHSLYQTLVNTTISEAGSNLNSTEQELLKSQLTLQAALTSLRALHNNSICIKNKLKDVLSAQFIPNIIQKACK